MRHTAPMGGAARSRFTGSRPASVSGLVIVAALVSALALVGCGGSAKSSATKVVTAGQIDAGQVDIQLPPGWKMTKNGPVRTRPAPAQAAAPGASARTRCDRRARRHGAARQGGPDHQVLQRARRSSSRASRVWARSSSACPTATDPNSPANNPDYIKALSTCAAKSNIVQALKDQQTAQDNLTPQQIEDQNKAYLKWRDCMIGRGWGIPKPKPDAKGRLFAFGAGGGSSVPQLHTAAGPGHLVEPRRPAVRDGDTAESRTGHGRIDDDAKQESPHRDRGRHRRRWRPRAGATRSWGGSSRSSSTKNLVILDNVQRRTLQDTRHVDGNACPRGAAQGHERRAGPRRARCTRRTGSTAQADDALFAIDGRDAIAEPGDVEFFRPLTVGDRGDDVVQLKEILAGRGRQPRARWTRIFTEQTRFALAQWQAANHYPGATPVTAQTVTVTLAPVDGLHDRRAVERGADHRTAAAPTANGPRRRAHRPRPADAARSPAFRSAAAAHAGRGSVADDPVGRRECRRGRARDVRHHRVGAERRARSTSTSRRAGPPRAPTSSSRPRSVTLPVGATSVQVVVPTRADNLVEPNKTLRRSRSGRAPTTRSVRRARRSTTIVDANVPELHISGGGSVTPGTARVLTVTADQAPVQGHAGEPDGRRRRDADEGLPLGEPDGHAARRPHDCDGHDQHAHHRRDPGRPPHRRRAHARGRIPRRVAGLGRRHDPRPSGQRGVAGRHAALGDDASRQGPALRRHGLVEQGDEHRAHDQPRATAATRARAPTTRFPAAASSSRPARRRCPVVVPTVADNVVESDRLLVVSVGASAQYRVGSPNSAAVTIASQVIPKLTITSDTTTVPLGGAATFTIHRRSGAGEGHVGQLPGRRDRAARPGLRTAARYDAVAARARRR